MDRHRRQLNIVDSSTMTVVQQIDVTSKTQAEVDAVAALWRGRINPDEYFIEDTAENDPAFDEPEPEDGKPEPVRVEAVAAAAPLPANDEEVATAAAELIAAKGALAAAAANVRILELQVAGDKEGVATWKRIRAAIAAAHSESSDEPMAEGDRAVRDIGSE